MAGTALPNTQQRFWGRVKKTDDCWEWTGWKSGSGYGRFDFAGRTQPAHRISWEMAHGRPIPNGLWVLHRCDNRKCVRPDHLFLGTTAENTADRDRKMRQAFGERNGRTKLTVEQVIAIKSDIRPHYMIADQYGVNQSTVCRIKRGERWQIPQALLAKVRAR